MNLSKEEIAYIEADIAIMKELLKQETDPERILEAKLSLNEIYGKKD